MSYKPSYGIGLLIVNNRTLFTWQYVQVSAVVPRDVLRGCGCLYAMVWADRYFTGVRSYASCSEINLFCWKN